MITFTISVVGTKVIIIHFYSVASKKFFQVNLPERKGFSLPLSQFPKTTKPNFQHNYQLITQDKIHIYMLDIKWISLIVVACVVVALIVFTVIVMCVVYMSTMGVSRGSESEGNPFLLTQNPPSFDYNLQTPLIEDDTMKEQEEG